MKYGIIFLLTAVCLTLTASLAFAANSDTITVNYEVQAINELNIDDASVTLTITTATPGQDPDQVTDSATYDITTNCAADAKKVTAAIDTDMPSGLTLKINMAAPTGGTSPGAVTLSSVAVDSLTALDAVSETNLNMTFSLDATAEGGVVTSASKTCTLTLTDS
jgi:hypothetical protein